MKREPEEIVTNEQANATVDLFWEQAFPKPIASRPVICALAKRALKAATQLNKSLKHSIKHGRLQSQPLNTSYEVNDSTLERQRIE